MPAALVWFRRDLRLADHAALHYALRQSERVHCAFVFDTDILDRLADHADRRVEFIHASVAELAARLRRAGGGLHVLHGPARRLIPELAVRLGVAAVYANRDYEPAAVARDGEVDTALRADGRVLRLFRDQVIFETDEVLNQQGRPFHVFTPYKRAWLARLDAGRLASHAVDEHLGRLAPHDAHAADLPGLEALGFRTASLTGLGITPGESGAQAAWRNFRERIHAYRQHRDYPGLEGTSRLSVHLRFGTLSVRELARHAREQGGEGSETWLSELIWREFYQMLLWHYPETAEHAFQRRFDALPWPNPSGHFEAWSGAGTGYPIVDAAMRQLDWTGHMHNRLRMIVASFLVKDLHVDWRLGERHFAAKLIDYDQAANVGGWQWCASVGTDAQPWFRIFNPVTQSERFDPDGRIIRRWLPELAAVPDRHLHAPWRMPAAAQAACGVIIGRDYPPPIVDHGRAREVTLALFRHA
ncbi:MAG TPA: deoxyribodipyrimidine photo-lyase [Thiobacillaceae bacterium]|nr:deoxyribodipyrimidine photo-lyase [Thiobacillaceae bacterium]